MASFLADVGHEVPSALLPSLLTSTLGAPASALGLIEGISDGLAGVARIGGGALADDPEWRRIGIGCVETAEHAAVAAHARSAWKVDAAVASCDGPRRAGSGRIEQTSEPRLDERTRHFDTVCCMTRCRAATAWLSMPAAHASTMRARSANAGSVAARTRW